MLKTDRGDLRTTRRYPLWHPSPRPRRSLSVNRLPALITEACCSAGPQQRRGVALRLNSDALGILLTFGHCAGVQAVRLNSPPLIAQGLVALAILGDVDDARDLAFYMATLNYSALKLGIDAGRCLQMRRLCLHRLSSKIKCVDSLYVPKTLRTSAGSTCGRRTAPRDSILFRICESCSRSLDDKWRYRVRLNGADHQWGKDPPKEVVG
jgi:hypothetical protein